jgi:Family of unknown function (DUF6445)
VFNPRPQVTRLPLYDDQFCLIIDDVLLNPGAWIAEAVARRAQFRMASSTPG